MLSRLTGSTVVSGYPKTGTTYLSHLAAQATGKPYIEGSMRFALRPSVIHTHFRRIPASAVFSFRPVKKVMASFVTHRALDLDPGFAERLRKGTTTNADEERVHRIARALLEGSRRLPPPSVYYADVCRRGGTVVNVLDVMTSGSRAQRQLCAAWGVSAETLDRAVAAASALSEARRAGGHEFYNRPSDRVRDMIDADAALSNAIRDEVRRTEVVLGGNSNV
ncbi:hypothetical protein ACSQ8I_01140 [Marinovum sp. E06]